MSLEGRRNAVRRAGIGRNAAKLMKTSILQKDHLCNGLSHQPAQVTLLGQI